MAIFRRRYKENVPVQRGFKLAADIVLVLCAGYMLMSLLCSRAHIIGNSMNEALMNGQSVLINRTAYAFVLPKRFDVIAFEAEGIHSSRIYVKRVVGLPGETVQIKEGKVYINGEPLSQDVVNMNILTAGIAAEPILLEPGEYFVLGDNRNNSEDSRFANIGMVRHDNIVGKVWLVVSPIRDLQIVR